MQVFYDVLLVYLFHDKLVQSRTVSHPKRKMNATVKVRITSVGFIVRDSTKVSKNLLPLFCEGRGGGGLFEGRV